MINRPLYVDKIMAYTDTPFVKVLTGVRRCGKSTILKMIMEKLQQEHGIPSERIVSMRFDSMDYEDMTAKEMCKEKRFWVGILFNHIQGAGRKFSKNLNSQSNRNRNN